MPGKPAFATGSASGFGAGAIGKGGIGAGQMPGSQAAAAAGFANS